MAVKVIYSKRHDLSNLHDNLNRPGAQFAKAQFAKTRFAGAQFAAPGTQFDSAPKSVGLNLLPKQRGARFAGAQFAGA